jgi:hypothetical protein
LKKDDIRRLEGARCGFGGGWKKSLGKNIVLKRSYVCNKKMY